MTQLTKEEEVAMKSQRRNMERDIMQKNSDINKIKHSMQTEEADINKLKHEIATLQAELVVKEKEFKKLYEEDREMQQELISIKHKLGSIR